MITNEVVLEQFRQALSDLNNANHWLANFLDAYDELQSTLFDSEIKLSVADYCLIFRAYRNIVSNLKTVDDVIFNDCREEG